MDTTASLSPVVQITGVVAEERASFLRRTYLHVGGALVAFATLEALLLSWPGAPALAAQMLHGYVWLLVLGAFVGLAYLAERLAHSGRSSRLQYAGLSLYVATEAVLFLPLLLIARGLGGGTVIPTAVGLTALIFAALTATVLVSGADFRFLRGALVVGGAAVIGLIGASIIVGFTLGLLFTVALIVYAAGAILYQTSAVLRDYRSDQHVAAALGLFAGVMLLLWYLIRLLISLSGDE